MEAMEVVIRFSLLLVMKLADFTDGITRGRPAKEGEFPYVVRIGLLETSLYEFSRLSTGVLVTTTRILTTCDSVGFWNYDEVRLYNLSVVTIRGGSVETYRSIQKSPNGSFVHPHCFFLSSGTVLFNLGVYEIARPFINTTDNTVLKPVKTMFSNGMEMGLVLKALWNEHKYGYPPSVACYTPGWGYPNRVYEGQGEPDNFLAVSTVLQVADMSVVSHDYCTQMTCKYFQRCLLSIWEYGWVCAEAPAGGGPCRNDIGSPLICEGQILAILTRPHACEDVKIPRHFVRLDLVFDFVFGRSGCSEFSQTVHFVMIPVTIATVKWLDGIT